MHRGTAAAGCAVHLVIVKGTGRLESFGFSARASAKALQACASVPASWFQDCMTVLQESTHVFHVLQCGQQHYRICAGLDHAAEGIDGFLAAQHRHARLHAGLLQQTFLCILVHDGHLHVCMTASASAPADTMAVFNSDGGRAGMATTCNRQSDKFMDRCVDAVTAAWSVTLSLCLQCVEAFPFHSACALTQV